MIDYKLFTIALVLIFVLTLITFMMKSVVIEIMLPLMVVSIVLFVFYLLFKVFKDEK